MLKRTPIKRKTALKPGQPLKRAASLSPARAPLKRSDFKLKPGTGLTRKTPLKAGSKPLAAGTTALKRAPFKRNPAGAPLKARNPLRNRGRKTQSLTAADKARFEAMNHTPCLACMQCREHGFLPTNMKRENHHLLTSGRRIGHQHTIRLCHYHHQGKHLPDGFTSYRAAAAVFGPSYERESARFHRTYGTDAELLARQNAILDRNAGKTKPAPRPGTSP